jgi:signal peptidase I
MVLQDGNSDGRRATHNIRIDFLPEEDADDVDDIDDVDDVAEVDDIAEVDDDTSEMKKVAAAADSTDVAGSAGSTDEKTGKESGESGTTTGEDATVSGLPKGARLVQGKNGETYVITETTVLHDIVVLLLKIAIIILAVILIFTFLFGFFRTTSSDMSPNVNNGDLIMYYRLDKNYQAQDLTLVNYKGQTEVRRVVATAGDCVDIDSEGLKINGALQQEPKIPEGMKTLPYSNGFRFDTHKCPSGETGMGIKEGEIFVLADNRTNGTDSRVYGAVKISDTLGKVNMILRRREF